MPLPVPARTSVPAAAGATFVSTVAAGGAGISLWRLSAAVATSVADGFVVTH